MRDANVDLREFARRYTAAWCSQNAANVAAFYAPDGSLCINGGIPATGRTAIAKSAQEFMTAFPDLHVHMDKLIVTNNGAFIIGRSPAQIPGPTATGGGSASAASKYGGSARKDS